MKKNKLLCYYCGNRFFRDAGHLNKDFKLSCPKCGDIRLKELHTHSSYPKDYFNEEEKDPIDIDAEQHYPYYD